MSVLQWSMQDEKWKNERKMKNVRIYETIALLIGGCILVLAIRFLGLKLWLPVTLVGILLLYSLDKVAVQTYKMLDGKKCNLVKHERLVKLLAALMGVFLANGSLLYMAAFYSTTQNYFGVGTDGYSAYYWFGEYFMRSILSSVNLFMFSIDSNIFDDIRDCPAIKSLISVQCIFSALCTMALILSLVMQRALAYFRLHRQTAVSDNRNQLYIFFGMNNPSLLLARDIHRVKGDSAIIIFVEHTQVNEEENSGWSTIVKLLTHRHQTFEEANAINARVALVDAQLRDIDLKELNANEDGTYDLLAELNVQKIKELMLDMKEYEGAEQHIFFLSDNEQQNIQDLYIFTKDETLAEAQRGGVEQHFYCHARRNRISRVVEDLSATGKDIILVDSSHLAVELIKQHIDFHPVTLVELSTENPTTVTSPFQALIVGFDEVGQDAMRFLYEFGAFVDASSTPEHTSRSPFLCTAIDKDMKKKRGSLEAFVPAVTNNPMLRLLEMDYNDGAFYQLLSPALNYILIAIGDEDEEIALAIKIFNYIRARVEKEEDLHRLRILVRCYSSEKFEVMQRIANHYNSACSGCRVINLFGMPEQIYSYDMVVNRLLINQGKEFMCRYNELKGEPPITWEQRRKNNWNSLDGLRKLHRQETQNLSNAIHAKVKMYLLEKVLPETERQRFLEGYFSPDGTPNVEGFCENIHYPGLTEEENQIVRNLAILEHLRWYASHEMMGYTRAPKEIHRCVERMKVHNTLIDWEELDEESRILNEGKSQEEALTDYKMYDYATVDTTISLYKNELLNK